MSHLDDFLDLYPTDDGPGPFTSRPCAQTGCGDLFREHSRLGPCMRIKPTMLMRTDGTVTREERTYCPCREYLVYKP